MSNCSLTQAFGYNANKEYKGLGMRGHPGKDEVCGYGSDVKPLYTGIVTAVYTPEKPASDGYTCVYILCKTELEMVEHSIGHLSEVFVGIGDVVTPNTVIGKEGNKGLVYSGGEKITLEMQRNGDKRGSHRHIQWRPVKYADKWSPGKRFMMNENGYVKSDGMFLEIHDYDNGYNGCVNIDGSIWERDLFIGTTGYDVYVLQKALFKGGYADYEATGYFGPKTFASVAKLQRSEGITPTGYFGPKTRAVLNKKYPRLPVT